MTPPESDRIVLPGIELDPDYKVKQHILIGWALVGAFFTLGAFGAILAIFDIIDIPDHLSAFDCARLTAFVVAIVNIGAWMYFPLLDLGIQRRWIRTAYKVLPSGTSEFLMIVFTTALLLGTILASLIHPLAFALCGVIVYTWNIVGYAYIKRQLQAIVEESRRLYEDEEEPGRTAMLSGLRLVEEFFCIAPYVRPVQNRQQLRLLVLTFASLVSVAIAGAGTVSGSEVLLVVSYYWSAGVFVVAEVWIAIWRCRRDKKLEVVKETWRRSMSGHVGDGMGGQNGVDS